MYYSISFFLIISAILLVSYISLMAKPGEKKYLSYKSTYFILICSYPTLELVNSYFIESSFGMYINMFGILFLMHIVLKISSIRSGSYHHIINKGYDSSNILDIYLNEYRPYSELHDWKDVGRCVYAHIPKESHSLRAYKMIDDYGQ